MKAKRGPEIELATVSIPERDKSIDDEHSRAQ
jgi:hypothetical protein